MEAVRAPDMISSVISFPPWFGSRDSGIWGKKLRDKVGNRSSPPLHPAPLPRLQANPPTPTGKQVGGCQKPCEFYCQPIRQLL